MPRILVIDDDASVRAATQTLLELEGHEVVGAYSGRNGLEKIAAAPFDAVIVDICMPGMDGFQTIKAFKQQIPEVPVIAMSGLAFRDSLAPAPGFLDRATKVGAAYSLQKPFRPQELMKAIAACLNGGKPA